MGGIVAMALRGDRSERWEGMVKWLAIPILVANALTLYTSFHFQTPWTAVIGYTLIAALFGTIVIGAIQWKWLRSLFENQALMSIGQYSYAMYLMHQIVRPGMPRLITSGGTHHTLHAAGWSNLLGGVAGCFIPTGKAELLRL
jgi:peptidoglycan/LPS O-acetylase OafA/YrhL